MIESLLAWIQLGDPTANALVTLAIGIVLLLIGAEGFVAGSVRLAERFGLPRVTVGLTLVAIGTSLPELSASLAAVLGNEGPDGPALAVGNALGSNVANIGFLLGLSAMITPILGNLQQNAGHLWLMLVTALVVAALGFALGEIAWWGGALGLLVFVVYNLKLLLGSNTPKVDAPARELSGHLLLDLGLFVVGCTLVVVGADVLVLGATDLAHRMGVSAEVIGAALVAVGTSVPELAVCISAARRREGAILVGNLVGSNIANICLVLGACAVVTPLPLAGASLWIFTPAVVIFSVLTFLMMKTKGAVNRVEGAFLLALYAGFQVILWTR